MSTRTTAQVDSRVDPRLERLLGGAERAQLRQRLRRHYERGGDSTQADGTGTLLHLSNLSAADHATLAGLTGAPARTARSMRLNLSAIDAILSRAEIATSLRDALEKLDGPIANRPALRAATESAWANVSSPHNREFKLAAWLQTPAALTLLKRRTAGSTSKARNLLDQAERVLQQLPAPGMTRAQLAASTLGSAHALDAGQPVAAIVLAVWRHAEATALQECKGASTDEPEADPDSDLATGDGPRANRPELAGAGDERTRDTWARAGVLVNELARPALVLNLPISDSTAQVAGEPEYLSLRQLLRAPPVWAVRGRTIFVCENPNLLAIAADVLGPTCAPLVCTDGMPAAAQRTLLGQLAQAGAQLFYHGDFDWDGIRIANFVLRTWNARPWRMAAPDYEAAARHAPHNERDLVTTAVEAMWDEQLAPAMDRTGFAIAEEAVADTLMIDLQRHQPQRW